MSSGNDQPVLIYTTFPGPEEAHRISTELVASQLAACVNLFEGMQSIYQWQGRTQVSTEVAGIIKTRRARAQEVMSAVAQLHPYDTPALVVLPCDGATESFARWIAAMTGKAETS